MPRVRAPTGATNTPPASGEAARSRMKSTSAGLSSGGFGVRHAADRRVSARRRGLGAGGDRLLVLVARLAQVDVRIDEARSRSTGRCNRTFRRVGVVDVGPDRDDLIVLDEHDPTTSRSWEGSRIRPFLSRVLMPLGVWPKGTLRGSQQFVGPQPGFVAVDHRGHHHLVRLGAGGEPFDPVLTSSGVPARMRARIPRATAASCGEKG